MIENAPGLNTGKRFSPAAIGQLAPYLHHAYCIESLCIDLQWTNALCVKHRGAAYRALFSELAVLMPSIVVNILKVCVDSRSAAETIRQLRKFCLP